MKRLIKTAKWFSLGIAILIGLFICANFFTQDQKPKALPERHGQVSKELFIGSEQPYALIVGLGGSEGGNPWASEHWRAQREKFTAQGYAFLALGYFGTKESPRELDRIALEGIHTAVMAAATDPRINTKCIILMGGSKGAELALTLASYYQDYTSVVAIVPGSAVFPSLTFSMNTSSFSHQGKELPFVPVPWSATPALITRDLRTAFEKMMTNKQAMADAAIKVENIQGSLLFLSATQDEMWPSTEMSEQMMQRLKNKGFSRTAQHIAIEGGHTEPLKHFDIVENFLATQANQNDGKCQMP